MNLKDAWNSTAHGKKMMRPSGAVIERWMSDKPGLEPAFDRFMHENIGSIDTDDLLAQDWVLEGS